MPTFIACILIMAVAQVIYTAVGFGAGMFAVTMMALVLPDLTDIVVVLLLPTLAVEMWVVARTWRQVKTNLLGWLVPGMAAGLWLGTRVLVTTDVSLLKRLLGLVVMAAGLYFMYEQRVRRGDQNLTQNDPHRRSNTAWISLPAGLLSGILGAMFGTAGPPVIIFLRGYRLSKAAFRSTILIYFLLMSLIRAGTYSTAGLVTADRAFAAALLLPSSVAGIIIGTIIHDRISEQRFSQVISVLLVVLGTLLVAGVGR